jgi:hypothetical protein
MISMHILLNIYVKESVEKANDVYTDINTKMKTIYNLKEVRIPTNQPIIIIVN